MKHSVLRFTYFRAWKRFWDALDERGRVIYPGAAAGLDAKVRRSQEGFGLGRRPAKKGFGRLVTAPSVLTCAIVKACKRGRWSVVSARFGVSR
jgi:hypothetical protein